MGRKVFSHTPDMEVAGLVVAQIGNFQQSPFILLPRRAAGSAPSTLISGK
jgi:hypothetical protein